MNRRFSDLAGETFDLLIIGGGILGAGVARDATLRGLKVALVEQDDFAAGTSSRSTKLIHGGFRYLEHGEFRLVAEALRERTLLQRLAAHLVKPQSFVLPVYERDPRPLWKIRIGMALYDLFAWNDRALHHRTLSTDECLAEEPLLPRKELRGGMLFYDCQMNDARLCLETILDANRRGATCVNYCEAVSAERVRERLDRVWVRDTLTGKTVAVSARAFLNAAGPWIEKVVGLTTWNPRRVALSPTKGVHLILPQITRSHGIYFQSRYDNRMLFLIPWWGRSLLGTTDTDYDGDPRSVAADTQDVDYLLNRLLDVMPDCKVSAGDVIASFAGIRPLLRADREAPSNRSREYKLVRHGDNVLSVAGGKYTTFRAIADHVVRRLFKILGRKAPRCSTADLPINDHRPSPQGELISSSTQVFASDVEHACKDEMAVTVTDVMRRRTLLALSPDGGAETAERVSRIMATHLGWDEPTRQRMFDHYLQEWYRSRQAVTGVTSS